MLVALRHLHPFWKEYANRKAFSMQMSSSHPTHHNLEIGSSHNWSWCDEVINWLWCFDFFDILDNSAYHSVNKSQIHWGMLFELQSLKWGNFHLRDIFLLLSPENKVFVLLSQVLGSTLFSKQILIRSFLVIEDDDVAKFFEFSKNSFGCSWAAWSSKTLPQMFISLRVFRGTPESRLDFLLELEVIRRCLGTWDCPELSQSRDHEILGRLTRNSLYSAILRLSQELWLTIFRSLSCCIEYSSNLFRVVIFFLKAASS